MIVSDFMVEYFWFIDIFVNIFFFFTMHCSYVEVNTVYFPTEPAPQNSGKASILTDATRILRDLILQVESLRKENVALVTESRYVSSSSLNTYICWWSQIFVNYSVAFMGKKWCLIRMNS